MRALFADTATPVHSLRVGARVRERRTGEVREVVDISRTLTEFRVNLDDGTYFDAGLLDTAFVCGDNTNPAGAS